jgi:hypothetical protein
MATLKHRDANGNWVPVPHVEGLNQILTVLLPKGTESKKK